MKEKTLKLDVKRMLIGIKNTGIQKLLYDIDG